MASLDHIDDVDIEALVESCKPVRKPGRPSHKRQVQEIRSERVINLQTADSVIAITNLKSILTLEALQSLPGRCQSQLVRLLPEFDQLEQRDDTLRPRETALNNEYFARFCTQYQEKLLDNKLSEKAVEQAKSETSKDLAKLDPWKLRNYEPIWGKKLLSQTNEPKAEEKMIDNILRQMSKRRVSKRAIEKRAKTRFKT